jgi:hypothetical protein
MEFPRRQHLVEAARTRQRFRLLLLLFLLLLLVSLLSLPRMVWCPNELKKNSPPMTKEEPEEDEIILCSSNSELHRQLPTSR